MSTLAFFVGGLLPYIAVVVFVVGMIYRFHGWIKTPQPGKITLFPARDSTFRGVLAEALLFPSLFRGDKVLWVFSWLFHATLALVLLGHLRVFTALLDRLLISMGMSEAGINILSSVAGGAAGVLLLATGFLLIVRRVLIPRVREISEVPDFLVPLLLIAIIFSGDLMRFGAHFDLEQTRLWAGSLVALSPIVPANNLFLGHAFLAMVLIMYMPFSKILHFGGIFFTQTLVKRR